MSTVPVKIVQDWSGEWLPDCLDLVDRAPFNDLTMDQKVWNLHGTRSAAFKSGNPVYKSRYDLVKTIVSGKRNFRTKLEAQLLRACGRVCMSCTGKQSNSSDSDITAMKDQHFLCTLQKGDKMYLQKTPDLRRSFTMVNSRRTSSLNAAPGCILKTREDQLSGDIFNLSLLKL